MVAKTKRGSRRAGEQYTGLRFTEGDLLLYRDGVLIAKRGHAGTPHAKTWISLEPGFAVFEDADRKHIIVEYKRVRVQ